MRGTVRRSADLEHFGIPVIEVLPNLMEDGRESYEELTRELGVSNFRLRGRSIVITNLDEAANSGAATEVAEALALRVRVILVDADLRRIPSKDPEEASGFAGMLLNRGRIPRGLYDAGNGVKVLPAGFAPGLPASPLLLPELPLVISMLRDRTDYVVYDAPPVFASRDLMGLVKLTDSTLLILEADRSKKSSVEQAVNSLHHAQGLKLVLRHGWKTSPDRRTSTLRVEEVASETAGLKEKPSSVSRRLLVSPVMNFEAVLILADLLAGRAGIHSVSLADFREDDGEAVFRLRQDGAPLDDDLASWLSSATSNDSGMRTKFPEPITVHVISG